MALMHREHPTYGLQFHPESLLTEDGKRMLANFLRQIPGISFAEPASNVPKPKTALCQYASKAVEGNNLTQAEAEAAMDIIMSGGATNAQIAALLTALRMKGETVEEITGFAKGMRAKACLLYTSPSPRDCS